MNKIKIILVAIILLTTTSLLQAKTYVVDNTNISGIGSFKALIDSVNTNPGLDIINFNILGTGPFTIPMNASLTITESVIINGFSQSGSVVASSTNNANLMIVLQGSATTVDGLIISGATDVTILGITFNRFKNAITLDNSQLCKIAGCYIGLDNTGLMADDLILATETYRNKYGIIIINNTSDCIIGGPIPGDRNVIDGNSFSGVDLSAAGPNNKIIGNYIGINADGNTLTNCYNSTGVNIVSSDYTQVGDVLTSGSNVLSGNYNAGVSIIGSNHCTVTGNYIGTDPTGMMARPNVQANIGGAVHISGGNANTIGGAGSKRNIISGNNGPTSTAYGAVYIHGFGSGTDAWGNVVIGNYIGVAADGITALPNIRGIYIDNTAFGNYIGNGIAAGQNIIAYNINEAIVIDGNSTTTNKIALNSVYCNGSGVTLSNFGNNSHSTPSIAAANNQRITGMAIPSDSIFVFLSDPGCGPAQGKTFLGATIASGTGAWSINPYPAVIGDNVVVIGYNSQGMTSKFSADNPIVACAPLTISAGSDQTACINDIVNLTGTMSAGQTGQWFVSNGTGVITDVNLPSTTLKGLTATGPVAIAWTVMDNSLYCSSTDYVTVAVNTCTPSTPEGIEVYNLVSPNGDGVYDYLHLKNAENFQGVHVSIVNRWGDEVFSIDNYDNVNQIFTGHANQGSDKGKLLPDGTYFYRIIYSNDDLKGYLELKK